MDTTNNETTINKAGETSENTSTSTNSEGQVERPAATNWKEHAKTWEDRAKQNLANLETATKTIEDLKSAAAASSDKLSELQTKYQELEVEFNKVSEQNLRNEVSNETGVPSHLLSGTTKEELEESAKAISEYASSSQSRAPYVPSEGKQPSQKSTSKDGPWDDFIEKLNNNR